MGDAVKACSCAALGNALRIKAVSKEKAARPKRALPKPMALTMGPKAQTDKDPLLGFGTTNRRTDLLDLDFRHRSYSVIASAAASASAGAAPPRPSRSEIFLPRRWATDFGDVCDTSASKVARIML